MVKVRFKVKDVVVREVTMSKKALAIARDLALLVQEKCKVKVDVEAK